MNRKMWYLVSIAYVVCLLGTILFVNYRALCGLGMMVLGFVVAMVIFIRAINNIDKIEIKKGDEK